MPSGRHGCPVQDRDPETPQSNGKDNSLTGHILQYPEAERRAVHTREGLCLRVTLLALASGYKLTQDKFPT